MTVVARNHRVDLKGGGHLLRHGEESDVSFPIYGL